MSHQTIPCVAYLNQWEDKGAKPPPGFSIVWTQALLRFDARQSRRTFQAGDKVLLNVDEAPNARESFQLIVTDIQETERTHVFMMEAARVDLLEQSTLSPPSSSDSEGSSHE